MRAFHSTSGFTLVEMAVVLVIMGLVMMTVFPALTSVRSASQQALTQSNLRSLMLATAAYVQANGCLPCPASAAVSGANFGRTGTPNNTACGVCTGTAAEGIPPYTTLGIPPAIAHDGWGRWITMRVDPALTANFGVVPPTAVCTSTLVSSGACTQAQVQLVTPSSNIGFCAANLANSNTYIKVSNGTTTSQPAAVIFVSHGSTGYGSCFAQAKFNANNNYRLPFPANYAACSTSGGYSKCNASAGAATCNAKDTTQFYDAQTTVGSVDPYDDVLAYADRNTLVSMFGNGACNTIWP